MIKDTQKTVSHKGEWEHDYSLPQKTRSNLDSLILAHQHFHINMVKKKPERKDRGEQERKCQSRILAELCSADQ